MKSALNLLKWPFVRFNKMSRKGKIIVLIILGLVILWRINIYRNSGFEVETSHARMGTITETIDAAGEISAENSANLSFQTPGVVTEVNYEKGDYVQKNAVIAKLDTTTLYAAYKQADATLRASQAALDYTYDTLQGKENSENFSEISTRTAAETTKDKAYWAFVSASKALEGAYIKAPFDGILTETPDNFVQGSVVSLPSSALFQMVGPQTVNFDADVSELDIIKLTNGAKAIIVIDAYPDQEFEGIVNNFNFASIQTSTGGTAYKVTITMPENNSQKFMLGMNGDASIILSEKERVLLIPLTALIEDGDETYVWKVSDGKAKKVKIETGISSVNDIEVKSGLSDQDLIITRPPTGIAEGVKLKLN